MIKLVDFIALFVLILMLVLVRFFESDLFYDPYLKFFQNDYLYMDSPRREVFKVTLNTTLRYVLNSAISLGLICVIFRSKDVVKLSALLYLVAFVVLIILYLYFVVNPNQEHYYLFFNIRRLLIHPVILILLIPAFYFHKIKVG